MTLFDTEPPRVAELPAVFEVTPACLKPAATLTFSWGGHSDGHRSISFSMLKETGRVGSCRFYALRGDLKESGWGSRDEPWLYVQRRTSPDAWQWDNLTDAANVALRREVAVALHRYGGFDKAWRAALQQPGSKTYRGDADSQKVAASYRELARWCDDVDELGRLVDFYGMDLEYRHVTTPVGQHPRRYSAPDDGRAGRWTKWAHITVELYTPDGELIGYTDGSGMLLPLREVGGLQ